MQFNFLKTDRDQKIYINIEAIPFNKVEIKNLFEEGISGKVLLEMNNIGKPTKQTLTYS